MQTWSRTSAPQKLQIAVLGTPVRDAYLDVDAIEFPDQQVVFQVGQAQVTIAYRGEPIRFGEKRCAQRDLAGFNLAGYTIRNGGGAYHTTEQLARLCAHHRLPVALSTIDAVMAWPELAAAYAQLGIRHISLALERSTTNLVLTHGQPDRLILKSPDAPLRLTETQVAHVRTMLPTALDVLVVNSPKSVDLAHVTLQHAQKAGAAQYSVLTPSLSVPDRIERLLGRDRASVCNLSEFALLAKAAGVDCPTQEETARCDEVAQAMAELAQRCKTGDLVVTLGARGCLAGDRTTGTLVHIGLHAHWGQRVQEQVRTHPERKNGIGDRFFGSFVLSHTLLAPGHGNRTVQATRRASVEMVRWLAPELAPDLNWFALRQLPHVFGAYSISRRRGYEWETGGLRHRRGIGASTPRGIPLDASVGVQM
jgi:sugar/nucleoside kinase (ribokinase family)